MIRKLINLPMAEKWLLAQALVLLPVNAVVLRLVSLKRWHGILAIGAPPVFDRAEQSDQIWLTARTVRRAARYGLFNANCLHRSLALWWMLRRQGIDSDLKIGARINGQQCEAHAWVECMGEVLNDSEDVSERFPPFNGAIIPAEAENQ